MYPSELICLNNKSSLLLLFPVKRILENSVALSKNGLSKMDWSPPLVSSILLAIPVRTVQYEICKLNKASLLRSLLRGSGFNLSYVKANESTTEFC